jgi:hypothetical protein
MAIGAAAQLYSDPGMKGSSLLTGLAAGERYGLLNYGDLDSAGLLWSVRSGTMDSSDSNLNVVLFDNEDFDGNFLQLSIGREDHDATFEDSGNNTWSVLLIASNQAGTTETRASFVNLFRSKWDSLLDKLLQGTQLSREGEPTLTWRMFPVYPPSEGYQYYQNGDQFLSSDLTYLHIQQELLVTLPWYWSNYNALVDYYIQLFVAGNQVQASVAAWYLTVDPGAKSSKIWNLLAPQVQSGMNALQSQLNNELAFTSALNPTDVYLLPGTQLTSLGAGPALVGNTFNDVTIVVVS